MQLPLRIRAFLFSARSFRISFLRKERILESVSHPKGLLSTFQGPRDPGGIDTLRGSLQAPLGTGGGSFKDPHPASALPRPL